MAADHPIRNGFGHVIFACNGIVCLSKTRCDHRKGTLSLKHYAQSNKTYIEWEPFHGDTVWKTDVDDLRRILVKRRRCLVLIYKLDEWNLEYYFPRANARSFVRMMEVTHCVKYKWNPIPFVMHFSIVEKQNTAREFSDLKVEHILGAWRFGHNPKQKTAILNRNANSTNNSAVQLSSVRCIRKVKTKANIEGLFKHGFRFGKILLTKIVYSPLVWSAVKGLGKATVNTVASLVKTHVVRSRFVQKLCGSGITTKIFGVAINFKLTFLTSMLNGAFRTLEYFRNDGCDEIQAIGSRYLIQ